jgi:uncharacterized protein
MRTHGSPLARLVMIGALAFGAAVTAPLAQAQQGDASPDALLLTDSFLAHHPDLKHRLAGIAALEDGRDEQAFREFQRAARYADKAAQAMVAEMLWQGRGTARDRAGAYAWMDLAAERQYPSLLVIRERYWAALDADEQARAIDIGQGVYAEYGDDVAKPRLERMLRRGKRNLTGSRVGFVGALSILVPGPGGGWLSIDGSQYYSSRYWDPKEYFAWQDEVWRTPPSGRVDVGPLDAIRAGDDQRR